MEKIKALYRQYLWLILILGLIAVSVGVILFSRWNAQKQFEQNVSNKRTEANRAVQESKIESGVAANYSIERRAEDAVREKVITPKLDEARRRSTTSKTELETAQKQYENAKNNLENLNRSITDNCRELQRLYPDTKFEYCQSR